MEMDELQRCADSSIWDDEKTKNVYAFPVQRSNEIVAKESILSKGILNNELYRMGKFLATKSPQTHVSPFKWAIDFLVLDGTEVLAADDGIITELQEESNEWGDGEAYRDKLNYKCVLRDNF